MSPNPSDDDLHPSIPEETPEPPDITITYSDLSETELIGSGGDADVYKATATVGTNSFPVALKQPRFEGTMHTDRVERFNREAKTWGQLDEHPNIVEVLDWGTDPVPWICMEYMDGGALSNRDLPMNIAEGLWTGIRICRALHHAHRHGVAHLDLKPGNILFRSAGADEWMVPKVSDWGLAKLLLEHSKSVEGLSPTYAAPEQFDPDSYGSPNDYTDIYQVGAIMYTILTGDPPFTGPNPTVMQSILEEKPPAPSSRNPDLPSSLDPLLLNALSKEQADRQESIVLFRQGLEEALEEVSPSPSERSVETAGLETKPETIERSSPEDESTPQTDTEPKQDRVEERQHDGKKTPEPEEEATTGATADGQQDEYASRETSKDPLTLTTRKVIMAVGGATLLGVTGIGAFEFLSGGSQKLEVLVAFPHGHRITLQDLPTEIDISVIDEDAHSVPDATVVVSPGTAQLIRSFEGKTGEDGTATIFFTKDSVWLRPDQDNGSLNVEVIPPSNSKWVDENSNSSITVLREGST